MDGEGDKLNTARRIMQALHTVTPYKSMLMPGV